MAKNVMNDIIVSEKRTIRKIPLETKKNNKEVVADVVVDDIKIITLSKNREHLKKVRQSLNPQFIIWLLAIVCLVVAFFGISMIFTRATIEITPRTENINFATTTYTAKLNSTSVLDLSYEVMTIKKTESKTLEVSESKQVDQKATGKVIIYNNYSATAQRFINNTRISATDGRVYRLVSSVIVPGMKKISGKNVPGSIETEIIADQSGEKYNMKVSDLSGDFKIPGFKGSPRYDAFYARISKDITGGFVGEVKVVSADQRSVAEKNLKSELHDQLIKEMYAEKPESYLVFENSYFIDYNALPDAPDGKNLKINIEADLYAIIFNNQKFSEFIFNNKMTETYGGQLKFIPGDDFAIKINSTNDKPYLSKVLDITLSGQGKLVWLFNENTLKSDLAGKKSTDLSVILNKYKAEIADIKILFRPVWQRYIPEDESRIVIKTVDL